MLNKETYIKKAKEISEQMISELSNNTLSSYKDKAKKSRTKLVQKIALAKTMKGRRKGFKKLDKRNTGIETADEKLKK